MAATQPDLFPVPPPRDPAAASDWGQEPERRSDDEPALIVDVEGFEGPLDLLLALSRTQKVDLTRISILQLAIQYLEFIEAVRATRLELAADYLVMAAWLAYLKSRLLLPEPPKDDEPSGEELAAELAFRMQRLEAMRAVSVKLMALNRLGRDVFARGAPEATAVVSKPVWTASLFDLLTAYASHRQRQMVSLVRFARRSVWTLVDAREILERLIGRATDWTPIDGYLRQYMTPETRATVIASSFSASLELVREGRLELRQSAPFAPLFLRAASPAERDAGDREQEA